MWKRKGFKTHFCFLFLFHREKKQSKQVVDHLSLTWYSIKYGRMVHIIAMAFRTEALLSSQSCWVKFKLFFQQSKRCFCPLSHTQGWIWNTVNEISLKIIPSFFFFLNICLLHFVLQRTIQNKAHIVNYNSNNNDNQTEIQ